jgi:hypothetical protein
MKKADRKWTNETYPYSHIDLLWRYRCENSIPIKTMAGILGCAVEVLDDAELHDLDLDDALWPIFEILANATEKVEYEEAKIDIPLPVEVKIVLNNTLKKKESELAVQKEKCGRTFKKIKELTDLLTELFNLPSIKSGIEKGKTLNDYILSNSRYQSLHTELMIHKTKVAAQEYAIGKFKQSMSKAFCTQ